MNAHLVSTPLRAALVPALVACFAFGAPSVAHAEGDDASETAAARTLAIEGVKLAQTGDCQNASDKLERAEKLKHSPIVLRYLGECQVKLGRWVEGSESLRKLLREPLPENPSPALTEAYESGADTLRDVKPRIPSMKIMLTAPADAGYSLKVDGKVLASSVVGVALPADPGEHEVEVTAPGFLPASSRLKLTPNSAAMVELKLERDPKALLLAPPKAAEHFATPPASLAPKGERAEPAPSARGASTGKVLGWVSYAVAAGGLGGIAFGDSAMRDEKALRASCPGRVCTADQKDALDFAKTKGTLSTIGFAVAGGGAILGSVLLLTSSGSSSSGAARLGAPRTAGILRPRASFGVGSVAVAGDF